VSILSLMLVPKQLQLMHELVPTATVIGLLVNPTSPILAEPQSRDAQAAARALGIQVHFLHASTDNDFDTVFATLTELQAAALVIGTDAFFAETSRKLGELTLHHAIPAIYQNREFAAAGGLMSYGTSLVDAYRQVGAYAGRVLHGDQPAVLSVQQVIKLELIINLMTAKALNLNIPPPILGRADEVIQ
jgi:putative ABC transport system substrate-binding protein